MDNGENDLRPTSAEDKTGGTSLFDSLHVDDPYFYTKRDEFTSEVFKIEIGGLPKNFGFAELKKLLNQKLHLNSHKLKTPGHHSKFAFVTFRCEVDREKALEMLNGYTWKGRTLSAKKANPAADPSIKKRQACEELQDFKKFKTDDELPISTKLKDIVMPLCGKPYDEQLQIKKINVQATFVKLARQIERSWSSSPKWLKQNRKDHAGMCCKFEEIKPSPVIEQYRNKCEFTVGTDPIDGRPTVGFRLARYSAGSMSVGDPSECSIVPQKALDLCKVFQEYIRKSDREPYNPEKYTGYWRQMTVRIGTNSCMAIVVVHPQDLSKDVIAREMEDLAHFFWEGNGKPCGLTSLFYQLFGKRTTGEEFSMEHLRGERHITESLMGLKFHISPNAFFQINSAAAELLYETISKIASIDITSTLLDVCCGTGAIGITLAKQSKRVIGIEMVASAVQDATVNAQLNDLNNLEFHCGKVEDILSSILSDLLNDNDMIAIVDPPRAGLHNKVVRTLRAFSRLQRIVYVSCDLAAASTNLTDFCRPESNNYRGAPFQITNAIAVDLFPQTNHCEVVLLLKRGDNLEEK